MQPRNLFLIDGAAGTGKSDLLRFVDRQLRGRSTNWLPKFTTRPLRKAEKNAKKDLDLEFLKSEEAFDQRLRKGQCYSYTYPAGVGAARYGFRRRDLEQRLNDFMNVFVIVRSAQVILALRDDFPAVNVVPVFVYTLPHLIGARLEKDGYPKDEIKLRMDRSDEALEDLLAHPTLYRHVLLNNSDTRDYFRDLRAVFDLHTTAEPSLLRISAREHYHLPDMLMLHKEAMVERLIKHPFDRNIFVMMRFSDRKGKADPLFSLISDAVAARHPEFNCVRADLPEWQITNEDVTNPYAVLQCCKYGIALFDEQTSKDTGAFVNIGIECAVMRMLNRPCTMLVQKGIGDIPFNLEGKIRREFTKTEEIGPIVGDWLASVACWA